MTALPKEILDAIKNPGDNIDSRVEALELLYGKAEKMGDLSFRYEPRGDCVLLRHRESESNTPTDVGYLLFESFEIIYKKVLEDRDAARN